MRPVYYLGVFIPAAIALELAHASPLVVFSAAALGVIPCAAVMGEATEAIAVKSGPGIGGLLNVTFGNAPELIIAFFALLEGLQEVVKASIVGSIIGNVLLVMGAAMVVGGWSRDKQTFSQTAASARVSMPDWALAAVWLKVCLSRDQPPTTIAAPITSSTLPMMEPTIEAFTTSCRPSSRAKNAMISSGALPNVTFIRPPMPGPLLAAMASVASPITAAHGITPSAAALNTSKGVACASSSTIAAGMKTAR